MRISDWSSDVCSSDLLADRERAIDRVLAREPLRHERGVLLDEDGGALLERRTVSLGPHVTQRPVAVEPTALIVEDVSDLVADDRSAAGVVGRRIPVRAECRRVGKVYFGTCMTWWCPNHYKKKNKK